MIFKETAPHTNGVNQGPCLILEYILCAFLPLEMILHLISLEDFINTSHVMLKYIILLNYIYQYDC